MRKSERLGITVSLVLLGLIYSVAIPLPARDLGLNVLGSELRLAFSGSAQLAVLMVAIVAAGVDATIRSHPEHGHRSIPFTATFWMVPILVTIASLGVLPSFPWWGYRLGFIALTGGLLTLIIFLQYRSADESGEYRRISRLLLNGVIYALALLFFVFLYGSRLRSILSATGVLVVGGMLSLDLLRSAAVATRRLWLYAGLVALLMGEITWALNYLHINGWVGGALLLILFYALTGVSLQHLWGRLSRRVVIEYAAICGVALAAVGLFVK